MLIYACLLLLFLVLFSLSAPKREIRLFFIFFLFICHGILLEHLPRQAVEKLSGRPLSYHRRYAQTSTEKPCCVYDFLGARAFVCWECVHAKRTTTTKYTRALAFLSLAIIFWLPLPVLLCHDVYIAVTNNLESLVFFRFLLPFFICSLQPSSERQTHSFDVRPRQIYYFCVSFSLGEYF